MIVTGVQYIIVTQELLSRSLFEPPTPQAAELGTGTGRPTEKGFLCRNIYRPTTSMVLEIGVPRHVILET